MFNQHHRGNLVKYSSLQKPEAIQLPFYLLTPFTLLSWYRKAVKAIFISPPVSPPLILSSWCSGFENWFCCLLTAWHWLCGTSVSFSFVLNKMGIASSSQSYWADKWANENKFTKGTIGSWIGCCNRKRTLVEKLENPNKILSLINSNVLMFIF